jgi:hypothetical protein
VVQQERVVDETSGPLEGPETAITIAASLPKLYNIGPFHRWLRKVQYSVIKRHTQTVK